MKPPVDRENSVPWLIKLCLAIKKSPRFNPTFMTLKTDWNKSDNSSALNYWMAKLKPTLQKVLSDRWAAG